MKIAGFVKDYRQELESEIWLMPPLYHRVWQWLKYKVNHAEANVPLRDGTTVLVKPGERITSIRKIAEGVAWYERGILKEPNPRTISEILKWLTKKEMVVVSNGKSNSKYTLVSLTNWEVYQEKDNESNGKSNAQSNSKTTVKQQSVHTNNNDNKEKNDKNEIIYTDEFELFWSAYPKQGHQNSKMQSFKNFKSLIKKKVDPSSLIQAAKNYGADCKTLCKTDYLYKASNFIGQAEYYKSYIDGVWEPAQQELFNQQPKQSKREQDLNELERIFDDYDRSNVQDDARPMLCELS